MHYQLRKDFIVPNLATTIFYILWVTKLAPPVHQFLTRPLIRGIMVFKVVVIVVSKLRINVNIREIPSHLTLNMDVLITFQSNVGPNLNIPLLINMPLDLSHLLYVLPLSSSLKESSHSLRRIIIS